MLLRRHVIWMLTHSKARHVNNKATARLLISPVHSSCRNSRRKTRKDSTVPPGTSRISIAILKLEAEPRSYYPNAHYGSKDIHRPIQPCAPRITRPVMLQLDGKISTFATFTPSSLHVAPTSQLLVEST